MTATGGARSDIYSPRSYAEGPPHDTFEHLRATDPVHWQDMPDGTGYWAVLRHADVVTVARDPQRFSASLGGVVLEDLEPEQLEMMRHMLLAMDPPVHDQHRRPLAPSFAPRVVAAMEGRVRHITRRILATAADRVEVDLVHDVCALLPSQVIGELLGLPSDDWPRIQRWAEIQTGGQDDDLTGGDAGASAAASIEMAMYGIELAAARRAAPPAGDVMDLLLATTIDGEPMSDVDVGSFFVQLVAAANDTTKTMLSSGTLALLQHPDQLAQLRADPTLIPRAVEEILRWANPLHYFRRTATTDTTLGNTAIRSGDKLAMVYTSANRDEAVFAGPHRFDIHRDPNPHLSFGIGGHFCLGAHLARLEGRIFFEELLATFPTIELAGDPQRIRSNLNNGLKALPVSLARS
jgi:cytochrome P450